MGRPDTHTGDDLHPAEIPTETAKQVPTKTWNTKDLYKVQSMSDDDIISVTDSQFETVSGQYMLTATPNGKIRIARAN